MYIATLALCNDKVINRQQERAVGWCLPENESYIYIFKEMTCKPL